MPYRLKSLASLVLLAFALLYSPLAHAELRVTINDANPQPMPVAIPDFAGNDGETAQMGRNMAAVITNNLRNSGLFAPIDPAAFIQDAASAAQSPRFADWRSLNIQALIVGNASREADGRIRVEFRLFDVFAEQQIEGTAYLTTPANWRRIAHIVSDAIYKRLTGEDGYFDTRIVYVAESGSATRRVKRLAIMDQDGENTRFLTDGSYLVLTPRFSPSTADIVYMAYTGGKPKVYLFNVDSGRQQLLGNFSGMSFAPRFSPDGRGVLMSLAQNGDSDIYSMDLNTRQLNRLTNGQGISTGGSYSPDGSQIAFESDRGGTQQIYTMSSNGANQRRISFGKGRYASPVWSPRGDLIAFTKMLGGRFYVGVMRPDGSGERLISEAFHVEGPTWAPNGRYLSYFKEQGNSASLYMVDITGRNERRIVTPMSASDPAWSPLLP